ncbi:hypothetical protein SAMN05444267_102083 [Chryseobacterium polytrichastri]|uniref:Uncharacterized protein n=1 Tax=Chryseobacterium polytrichastri TaxID=1302687 RepID=A0A1M7BTD2_9FLAO|nr:hypothetical protein SAMN05444267_102083 [Chryseobacterium polytrichastri]
MKVLLITAVASLTANAPTNSSFKVDERSFELIAPIVLIGFLLLFIHAVIKLYLNSRLKNNMVEKNTPDSVVSLLLRTSPTDNKDANLKWFILFFGLGIALTVICYTLPFGYHSLAIIVFCLSGSFLAYHLLSKNKAA